MRIIFLFLLARRVGAFLCPTHHNAYIFARPMQGFCAVESQRRRTKIERYPRAEHHPPKRSPVAIISHHDHHRERAEGPAAAPAPSQGADVDQYREGYKIDREGWAQSNTRFAPQPRMAGVPTTAGRHGGRATRLEGAPIWRTNYPTARVLAATDRVRARLVDSQSVPRGSKSPHD